MPLPLQKLSHVWSGSQKDKLMPNVCKNKKLWERGKKVRGSYNGPQYIVTLLHPELVAKHSNPWTSIFLPAPVLFLLLGHLKISFLVPTTCMCNSNTYAPRAIRSYIIRVSDICFAHHDKRFFRPSPECAKTSSVGHGSYSMGHMSYSWYFYKCQYHSM